MRIEDDGRRSPFTFGPVSKGRGSAIVSVTIGDRTFLPAELLDEKRGA